MISKIFNFFVFTIKWLNGYKRISNQFEILGQQSKESKERIVYENLTANL